LSIFVIATNNTGVHVYRDAQSVVDAKEIDVSHIDSVDFFDVRGYRLSPVISDTGELTGLRDAGERPDAYKVQARLCAVRAYLVTTVDVRLAAAGSSASREEALSRLPELDGRGLTECYSLLEPVFGHAYGDGVPTPRDDGGWWHNLWAH
jgi:hypothetical protein